MDSSMGLEHHINVICKRCHWQLRKLSKLRPYLSKQSLEKLVHSMISSQLDFCNSLLIGLPSFLVHRLQKVQNIAARIVSGTKKREHITPVLYALHWLPVERRIEFKILVLVFKCIHGVAPIYLGELITGHSPTRNLRSRDQFLLNVPFTRSMLASDRAFSVVGPTLWNALPKSVRSAPSLFTFKKLLKTHLFRVAFYE